MLIKKKHWDQTSVRKTASPFAFITPRSLSVVVSPDLLSENKGYGLHICVKWRTRKQITPLQCSEGIGRKKEP